MKKIALFLCSLIVFNHYTSAQNSIVQGIVADTSSKENISKSVVSILRAKDSVLVKFSRTTANGNFEINNLLADKYIIVISYPNYADFVDVFDLKANDSKRFGTIAITLKSKLLEEVIVKQKISAIRIKGDTTEYKADSFKVGLNANVQDLLKKLPGIQVNSKGEITTQGQKVEKILVDGEEFFSDDPAVVSQTLRADAVNNVQVFDKKSDQAVFSGIDDGVKTKTINLQLKEDKKKGYFGKVEGGTDFTKYTAAKLMANSFKGKRKLAGYLTYDNSTFNSLDWSDQRNYGGDMNSTVEFGDDGSMYSYNTGDEFSNAQGLPSALTGGFLYSKKWNKDKQNINNNYQFNQQEVRGKTTSITQTILPDTTFTNTSEQNFVTNKLRHKIRSVYDFAIDSTSSIKITITGSLSKTKINGTTIGKSITDKGVAINSTERNVQNNTDNTSLLSNILYRKRFKKKGRTFSLSTDLNMQENKIDGYLTANNSFFDKTGNQVKQEAINQYKPGNDNLIAIGSKASYTEPIWKNVFAEVSYKIAINNSNAQKLTFNKSNTTSIYDAIVDSLSNDFIFNTTGHTGGVNFKYQNKKFNFSLGSNIGSVVFKQTDNKTNITRDIFFTNYLPQASIQFTPSKQKRIGINYNGSTRNPTLQQIQPIINNIDPLNITIGNPNLKQEFRHTFSLNANDYKVIKSKSVYVSLNFTTVSNAITNANSIDSLGRRINQAINVSGNFNGNMYSNYNIEVVPSFNLGLNFNPSISRNVNFVNGKRNVTDNQRLGFNINGNYFKDAKWINFYGSIGANFNNSVSSINAAATTKYWMYNSYAGINLKFPKKWKLDIEENISIYEKTSVFRNQQDIFIINATLLKSIDKKENWQAKLVVRDIFNNNQGINRNISSNFISETSSQTIQRVFLISLVYNFSKNGQPTNGW